MRIPFAMLLLASCAAVASPQDAGQGACTYDGASYEEGRRTEGASADHLCLPSGGCPQATVVLPVFQCTAGKWECVSNCKAAGGAPAKPAQPPAAAGKRDTAPQKEEKKAAGGQGGGCKYEGKTYPVGKRTEGSSPMHLCLPSGGCPQATMVLPVFECSASGQWRCIQTCHGVGGAETAAGNAAQRKQVQDRAEGGAPGVKAGDKPKLHREGTAGSGKKAEKEGLRRTDDEGTRDEDVEPQVRGTETAGHERTEGGKDPVVRAGRRGQSAGKTGKADKVDEELKIPEVGGGKPVADGGARAPVANERKQLKPTGGFTNLRENTGTQQKTGGNPYTGTQVDAAGTVKR